MPDQQRTKTVLELDLVSYADVAKVLEENLDVTAVKAFEDQIQSFVDRGLESVNLRRADVVLGTAGDSAVLMFDSPELMHGFACAVQEATVTHNQSKTVDAAKRWFRLGAATGIVLIRESERRIVGSTVTRAVRLEAAAAKGELLIDVATYNGLPENLKKRYGIEELVQGKRGETFRARRWHGREIDGDVPGFSVAVLRGRKKIREDAAAHEFARGHKAEDRSAGLIEFPYARNVYELFESVSGQHYSYMTTATLRELMHWAGQPPGVLNLAGEVIAGIGDGHQNVVGILSTVLSVCVDAWQPTDALLVKFEQLCDGAIREGDWSRITSTEPLSFILAVKGRPDVHRRVLERLIENHRWRTADATRMRNYYGSVGAEINAIRRHWSEPWRQGLVRVNDVGLLMDLLVSSDNALPNGAAQGMVLDLLAHHAEVLRQCGEVEMARRVNDWSER